MSYATLSASIQEYTQNNEPTFLANIDRFIQDAERMIHNEASLPSSRKNTAGVMTIGSRSLTLPTDYIVGKAVEITTAAGVVNLLPKAAEFLNEMYPVAATQAQPKYYAQYDETTLIVAPTPDLAYAVNFHYFAMPTSIVTAGDTWLDTKFPQVLLYGSLLHAYVYMKGSADIMAYYKAAYDLALKELKDVTAVNKMGDYR
jgi:hypothetical protein